MARLVLNCWVTMLISIEKSARIHAQNVKRSIASGKHAPDFGSKRSDKGTWMDKSRRR